MSAHPGPPTDRQPPPVRVLLAIPFGPLARSVEQGLREEGFQVAAAAAGLAGEPPAGAGEWDVLVVDGPRRAGEARDLLEGWVRRGLRTPVLLLTDPGGEGEPLPAGLAADHLDKPFLLEDLFAGVRRLVSGQG